MNNLKQYAGLLNEEAPENHFLAYITPNERDMLVEAGGVKTPTASGIFAYPPPGEKGGAGYVGESSSSSNNNNNNDNDGSVSQGRIERIGSGIEPGYRPEDAQPYGLSKEEAYRQGKITKDQYESTDVAIDRSIQESPSWFDGVKDYITSGGTIGMGIRLTEEVLSKLGEFSSELQSKAMTMALNSKVKSKMKDLDLNNPNSMNNPVIADLQKDLAGIADGTFTQTDFTKKYTSSNLGGDGGDGDREIMNTFTPYAADAIGNTTPQESMVDKYFANLNNTNLGISENYLNTYNTAKTKMANTLNITPPNQQYGYGNIYNDTYARQMNNSNVFYNYLNEQGLI